MRTLSPRLNLGKLILALALLSAVIALANTLLASYRVQRDQLVGNTLEANRVYATKLAETTQNFLLAAQQQLDVQILLMKLAPAIRHRLCQILAHQAEQHEAVDLLLAEGGVQPAFDALHHLDHDAVQRDLFLHSCGVTLMEVRELGPGIDLGVRQANIRLGRRQLVGVLIQRRRIFGFAIGSLGVSAACDRTRHANEDFLAFDLGHRNDVDALQEVRFGGNGVVQLLGDRRFNGKHLAGQRYTVGFGDRHLHFGVHLGAVGAQGASHVRAPALWICQWRRWSVAIGDRKGCSSVR